MYQKHHRSLQNDLRQKTAQRVKVVAIYLLVVKVQMYLLVRVHPVVPVGESSVG